MDIAVDASIENIRAAFKVYRINFILINIRVTSSALNRLCKLSAKPILYFQILRIESIAVNRQENENKLVTCTKHKQRQRLEVTSPKIDRPVADKQLSSWQTPGFGLFLVGCSGQL